MTIIYKNSKTREPNLKRRKSLNAPKYKDTYYDESGKPTTDEGEIKKIEREIQISKEGGVTAGNTRMTKKEYEDYKIDKILESRNPKKQELLPGELSTVEEARGISSELERKRINQPSLQTEELPFTSSIAELGLLPAEKIGNYIRRKLGKSEVSRKDLAETPLGKFLGLSTAAVGATASILLAAPYVASMSAAAISRFAFLKGKLSLAAGGVATYFGLKNVLDYKGGELEVMRGILAQYTEDGEKVQALASQGADPITELEILMTYSEEIDYCESVIKEIGNDNIEFRYKREYIKDMGDIRTARTAVQRRIDAILKIMETGSATVNPEALMYLMGMLEE